jgi:DUF1365 family protein
MIGGILFELLINLDPVEMEKMDKMLFELKVKQLNLLDIENAGHENKSNPEFERKVKPKFRLKWLTAYEKNNSRG